VAEWFIVRSPEAHSVSVPVSDVEVGFLAGPHLVDACAKVAPFLVALAEFRFFLHPSGKATLWLGHEPREAGFTAHLSVGQASSAKEARRLLDAWQVAWEPIRFQLFTVAILKRGPDTPFAVERLVPLALAGA
jgi:hypothetical protein